LDEENPREGIFFFFKNKKNKRLKNIFQNSISFWIFRLAVIYHRQNHGDEVERDEQSRDEEGRGDGHRAMQAVLFAKSHSFSLRLISAGQYRAAGQYI
jgi:hypothetical protein